MIICSRHWDRLRQLICERGLGHLMHQPHDDMDQFAADVCGRHLRLAFEPMRTARALATDFARARKDADPNGCAVCALIDGISSPLPTGLGLSAEAYWPAVIVEYVVIEAQKCGLTPRAA